MLYSRVMVDSFEMEKLISLFHLIKKSEFAFYDLIYMNHNGTNVTEDTLKIRVYLKNEWDTKNVLVIRKTVDLVDGAKKDKVLLQEGFDTVEEAKEFVETTFGQDYSYAFQLSKNGEEYTSSRVSLWFEEIDQLGKSIEIGADNQDDIEQIISQLQVTKRLTQSVPEELYEKLVTEKKLTLE